MRPMWFLAVLLFGAAMAGAQAVPGSLNQQPTDDPNAISPMPPTYAPGVGTAPRRQGPVRISGGVMAGMILSKVQPVYPAEARRQHIAGAVVLSVRVGKDGSVEDAQPISGPSELLQPAEDAVRQWTFRPYLLNGNPVEVNTTVTLNFNPNDSGS